jgi:hypothetical protein
MPKKKYNVLLDTYLKRAIPYTPEELARITASLGDKLESDRWNNEKAKDNSTEITK